MTVSQALSPGRRNAAKTAWLTFLAIASQAAISMCSWGIGAILPELAALHHLNAAGVGAIVAAGSLGVAAALVPAGAVVDSFGPRPPMVVGGIASAATLAWAGRAASVPELIAAFALFGVVSSLVVMAGSVALFSGVDPARRGVVLGLRQMAVALGGLLSAVALAPVIDARGVRFGLDLAAGLALGTSLVFAIWAGAEHHERRPLRIDVPGLLAVPGMSRLIMIAALFATALATVLSFATTALRAAGGTLAQTSRLFLVISVSAMVARIVWGRVADRRDAAGRLSRWRSLQLIGVSTFVGAVAYWALADTTAASAGMALFAFGALGANGVIHLSGGELAGPARAGQAMGLTSTVLFGVSGAVAPLLGAIADRAGYDALWLLAAGCGALAAALATRPAERGISTRA